MINADKKRFIKQHAELYGNELFLDTLSPIPNEIDFDSSKSELLEILYNELKISLSLSNDGIEKKLLFGSGDPNADILIIGESPSDYEIEDNLPFLGSCGKLLDKILKAIGYTRSSNVYLTYLVKYKVNGSRDPLISEVNKFIPFLSKQIKIISPKIIVGLGKAVGKALINKDLSISQMRNEIHNFDSYPLKITYSPNALLIDKTLKKLAWEDFQLIRDFIK